jgi:AraC-like DNA-binding protein
MDGEEYPILPNEFTIIPAWIHWSGATREGVAHEHISFTTPQWTARFTQANFSKPLVIQCGHSCHSYLTHYFDHLLAVSDSQGIEGKVLEADGCFLTSLCFYALSIYLRTHPVSGEPRPQELYTLLHYIDEHLNEDLSVERLSEIQGCARAYFSRRFSLLMGQSASDYVREMRLTRASELLITTQESIELITENCGFRDRFQFSRVFKRHFRESPASFRKQFQA